MANARAVSQHLLITGVPGVGKTTLMMKLHQELVKQNYRCSGFFTEEVRVSGRRVGFDVVTIDGQRGSLARISESTANIPEARQRAYTVGQYTVNLLSFEQIALPCLQLPMVSAERERKHVFFVDEIGKMELFSQNFVQAIRKLMSQPDVVMIATIPVPKGRPIPFVEELRNNEHAVVFMVTHQNRDTILSSVIAALNASTKC